MIPFSVETGFSGSHCVLYRTKDHFMDCRVCGPSHTRIEVVSNGHVYRTEVARNEHAPEVIMHMVREEFAY